MLKPLTLSVSLAVALGASSVSLAGGLLGNCTNCGIASPQGTIVSPQSAVASCDTGCDDVCDPCAKKWKLSLPKISLPKLNLCKPKMYTYTWVLKKKRVWGHHEASCDDCSAPSVVPSGQHAAPMPAPQAMPKGQHAMFSAPGQMSPAAFTIGDSVPPAPEVVSTARGSLLSLTPSAN